VYLGAQSTGAVNVSLVYSAAPVLIAVGSALWLQERMRWARYALWWGMPGFWRAGTPWWRRV
jgi:drug/metabolite transporter (DMT)-like permease